MAGLKPARNNDSNPANCEFIQIAQSYFFGVFKKTSVTRSPDWPGDLEMELI